MQAIQILPTFLDSEALICNGVTQVILPLENSL